MRVGGWFRVFSREMKKGRGEGREGGGEGGGGGGGGLVLASLRLKTKFV